MHKKYCSLPQSQLNGWRDTYLDQILSSSKDRVGIKVRAQHSNRRNKRATYLITHNQLHCQVASGTDNIIWVITTDKSLNAKLQINRYYNYIYIS